LRQVCDCLKYQRGKSCQERWERLEDLIINGRQEICGYSSNALTFKMGINFVLKLHFIRPTYRFLFLTSKYIIVQDEQAQADYHRISLFAKKVEYAGFAFHSMKRAYKLIRAHTHLPLMEFNIDTLSEYESARKKYCTEDKSKRSPFISMCKLLSDIDQRIDINTLLSEKRGAFAWTPEALVEHYGYVSTWYERPLLDYLRERAINSGSDSLKQAARHIMKVYLDRIRIFNPNQIDFNVSYEVASRWKGWAAQLETGELRLSYKHLITDVRSFYNWLEVMSKDDPEQWKQYVAHNPISAADIQSAGRELNERREESKNKTAIALPYIPAFRIELWRNYILKNSILASARSAGRDDLAEFDGITYKLKHDY